MSLSLDVSLSLNLDFSSSASASFHRPPHLPSPRRTRTKKCTSWAFFFLFGHIRDFFRNLLPWTRRALPKGYVPVRQDYEDFYTRRMFYRIHDCWNRPIGSAPDAYVDVLERTPVRGQRALELTGNRIRALNLGSYNYLGFAAHDPYCTPRAVETLRRDGWSSCSPRAEAGTTQLHVDLEGELAAFLGKPAALCFGMGFATNSAVLPALAGPGCLIVSDALNHASIVSGARGDLARLEQHNGHHGRVPVPQHVDPQAQQPRPEVVGVVPQPAQLLAPPRRAVGAREHPQRGEDLLGDGGGHGRGLEVARGGSLEGVDELFRACDVAAGAAKGLGEGSCIFWF